MDRDEERRIIAQVCAGDTNAFEALVVAYQKQVYNLALRTVGNEEDAADMTQEVFLRAYRALGTFRSESKFSVWLYRLTTNVCIDFLRSRRRHPTVSLTASEDDDEQPQFDLPADESVGPEQQLTRSEMCRSVARGLDSLPDDARKILILRELDGLSYAEIGKVLRLEAGTVKSRLFRARRRLCDFLLDLSTDHEYLTVILSSIFADCSNVRIGCAVICQILLTYVGSKDNRLAG